MKIVIVGDGKVGSALTEMLSGEEHDIVIIDSNKRVLNEALESSDVRVVHGNGAAWEVQQEADVEDSDLFIAATSADEINILSCMLARRLGCPHTIARVRNPDYRQQLIYMKDELGLSMTVNPELSAAQEIFRLLQFPSFMQRDTFAKGRVEIVQIDLSEGSRISAKLAGKTLSEIYRAARVKLLVCSVERGNKVYIPDGEFRLKKGDSIFVTALSTDLARLMRNLELVQEKLKNVLIVGGGRISFYLARELLSSGIEVKIIEKDARRCRELAEYLPQAMIIEADGTEKWLLDAEGIQRTDAVITLTNMDEENLIISMYADFKNVPNVITKMNRTEYAEVFRDKGIERVVSPKELCSHEIARYVRAMQLAEGDSALTLHRIGRMEALEFRAAAETNHLGVNLSEVSLRPGILIACINRGGRIIIPGGKDTLEEGDTVIIATTADRKVKDLNDIFANEYHAEERAR